MKACGYDETAVSTYEPLLLTNHRPDTGFFTSAAGAELAAIQCRMVAIGTEQSDPGQINLLLKKMALFLLEADGLDNFIGAILGDYRVESRRDIASRKQDVQVIGQVIRTQIGERTYKGKTVSVWIDEIGLEAASANSQSFPPAHSALPLRLRSFRATSSFPLRLSKRGLSPPLRRRSIMR